MLKFFPLQPAYELKYNSDSVNTNNSNNSNNSNDPNNPNHSKNSANLANSKNTEQDELYIVTPRQGEYRATSLLGAGSSDQATCYEAHNRYRKLVVIAPLTKASQDEPTILRKYNFFKKLYSPLNTELFYIQGTYRLVIPHLPGKRIDQLSVKEIDELSNVYTTLTHILNAYKRCHQKQLVYIDTNPGNILFHFVNNKLKACYLVDGGMAQPVGTPLKTEDLQVATHQIKIYIKKYPFIAPELWYEHKPPATDIANDVYSFGRMALYIFKLAQCEISEQIKNLIYGCIRTNPQNRLKIDEIESQIESLKNSCFQFSLVH